MAQPNLSMWRETKKPEIVAAVRKAKTISPFDSACLLAEGFARFQERTYPSTLPAVSFNRIAGQAIGLDEKESREEVGRILRAIRPGGAFVVLGHGGIIPCGAVGAKKAAIDAAARGETLDEPEAVLSLLDRVSPNVHGLDSPAAELENAKFQALKILDDPEFAQLIMKHNLTVLVAICSDCQKIDYYPMNRPADWDDNKLYSAHSKLYALKLQLSRGLGKVVAKGIDLKSHYAHATIIYDPLDMRTVLDPGVGLLEVGGICCVDGRLKPNTPDGPKYLFRVPPNQTFDITVDLDERGAVIMSVGDKGSDAYRMKHVLGTKTEGDGERGNGHVVTLATSLDFAMNIKEARLANNNIDPDLITVAAFNGSSLRMINPALSIDWHMEYNPIVPICNGYR